MVSIKKETCVMAKIVIDYNKCDGDGNCVSVCPVSVYELQDKPEFKGKQKAVATNSDACIVCRACEVQCPQQAITIEE